MKRQYMADFRTMFGLNMSTLARMCRCSQVLLEMLESCDKEVTHPNIALRIARVYGLTKDQYESLLPECHRALSADYVPDRNSGHKKSVCTSTVARPILQIKDGKIIQRYESIRAAAKATGIYSSNICHAASGKLRMTGGYEWKYE